MEIARDQKFRFDLNPAGAALKALAGDIRNELLAHEARNQLRQRKRKPADLAAFENAVGVIVANLAHFTLFPPEAGAIILPMGHPRAARVEASVPGFGTALGTIVSAMETIGVLHSTEPEIARFATTIAPTQAFRDEVLARHIGGEDFEWRRIGDSLRLTHKDTKGRKTRLRVPKTAEAASLRQEVEAINEWLARADISYIGNMPLDVRDRRLVRCFNQPPHINLPSLSYGGRLFGGFWQRHGWHVRQHIRIGGESVAEVDYGQMLPRLAYAEADREPPTGDLYAVAGTEGCRATVKKAFNALLFKVGTLRRWPLEILDELPEGWTGAILRTAILGLHPGISRLVGTGIGYRLFHHESTIMCAVLMRCMAVGVVALPVHDAVVCPASAVHVVSNIMREEAYRHGGATIPVSVQGGDFLGGST